MFGSPIMVSAIFALVLLLLVTCVNGGAQIDSKVLKELDESSSTDIILEFVNDMVTEAIQSYKRSRPESTNQNAFDELPNKLMKLAEDSQATVRSYISGINDQKRSSSEKMGTTQLWITNELAVRKVDRELVDKLANMANVTRIKSDRPHRMQLSEAISKDDPEVANVGTEKSSPPWSVQEVKVPEVWAKGNRGKGVVIGIIDTGFHAKHKALAKGFRSDHGWFDAVNGKEEPYDDNSIHHGTAVLCSVVGRSDNIGIAPDAQWIGCKGVDGAGYGRYSQVKKCMEFMACPTDPKGQNPDCSKRAAIVSHSIALDDPVGEGVDYSKFFDVYETGGVLIAHMAGNYVGCNTITREAAEDYVLTVASSSRNHRFYNGHAQGPTPDGRIKPEIIAPGNYVPTCDPENDEDRKYYTGTSFSSPIVAGIGALLLSVNPKLTQKEFKSILTSTARLPESASSIQQCGSTPASTIPNNMFGYGIVDALAAYEKMMTTNVSRSHAEETYCED